MLDIAILEGARTPFAKANGVFASLPAQELGRIAAVEAMRRADLRPDQIDQVVVGNVVQPADAANIARVVALKAGVPADRIAHTVQRNCASGMEAITTAAQLIRLGEAKMVLAGGVESMSRIPLLYSTEATALYLRLSKAKTAWQRLKTLLSFRPRHFKPVVGVQLGLTDPMCGKLMGSLADFSAREFGVTRADQDAFGLESHRRAADAQKRGVLAAEIAPVGDAKEDNGVRKEQTLDALARLKPFFEKDGTVTVGNSSQVTDGAAAVIVAPGAAVRAEGRRPLGYLRAFAYAGVEPERMALGPIYATSKLLAKTGLRLEAFDLIEMNEAFAAVVLVNEKAFASDSFAREMLGRESALGMIDPNKLNVNGGAIALGHPVGATGTRLVLTLLKELRRRGLRRGLATLCVGGGQGGAAFVETAE
ncbi:MAG TPA: thiolase family protein [Gemmataceae bacterium]|nr:thiolase family protein [Gemmataceae bacterium]